MKRYEMIIHIACSDDYESGEKKW